MSNSKSIKKLVSEAIDNVRDDRQSATDLLSDVGEYVGKSQDRHREVGIVAAKYLEVLQKSNEQLVKIVTLMGRTKGEEYEDLDDDDRDELFEIIEGDTK